MSRSESLRDSLFVRRQLSLTPGSIVGCVNVNHDSVDCPAANLRREDWCAVCSSVTVQDVRGQLLDSLRPVYCQHPPIYCIHRYQSRTRETLIVDFLLIRSNTPIFLTQRLATLIPRPIDNKKRFTVSPGQQYSGLVLHKTTPEMIIERLSLDLFGSREALKVYTL